MKPIIIPEKSAKQFLIDMAHSVLAVFDVPQNILGFNVENIVKKQIYAMSEESAKRKLEALKELIEKW